MCPLPSSGKGLGLELPTAPFLLTVFFILCFEESNLKHVWNCSPGHRMLSLSTQPGNPNRAMSQTPFWSQAGHQLRNLRTETFAANLITQPHNFSRLWVTLPLSPQSFDASLLCGWSHCCHECWAHSPLSPGWQHFISFCVLLCHTLCLMLWKAPVTVRSINTVEMSVDN